LYATKPYAEKMFGILRDIICELPDDAKVQIDGFGVWCVKQRKGTSKEVMNWKTKKRVVMDSTARQVTFTASKRMKEKLQGRKCTKS
jgi:nucleoid DNA-binding protein